MSWFRRRRRVPTDRPLTCAEVARVLQQVLDAEAPEAVAARVHEHLEDCRRCGLEAEVYARIHRSLADRSPGLPDDAVSRLRAFGQRLAHGDADGGSDARR
jgi:predicted anti-sigma-YlaC factor YlaD